MLKANKEKTTKPDSVPKAVRSKLLTAGNATSSGFNSIWHNLAVYVAGAVDKNTLIKSPSIATDSYVQRLYNECEQEHSDIESFDLQGKLELYSYSKQFRQQR